MPSVKETLDLPLSRVMSMSKAELQRVVQQLSMESNKRIAQFKRRGSTSPATAYIKKHGGKFTSKDKNLEQLREEYQRAKGFLEAETSTVKGFKEWENKVATTLEKNTARYITNDKGEKIKIDEGINYNDLTELQKRKFWKIFAKLEELDQANVYSVNYRGSVNAIYQAVKGGIKMRQIDAFVAELDKKTYLESAQGLLEGENNPFNL